MTCYAESKDGIHWKKPELGLVEFNGSKANNIVMATINGRDYAPKFAIPVSEFHSKRLKSYLPALPRSTLRLLAVSAVPASA